MRHAGIDTGKLQVLVLHVGPALPDFQQLGFALRLQLAAAGFLAAATLRVFGVCALEEKLRVAGDAVQRPLGIHDVRVRLFALFNRCLRDVNRVSERVEVTDLLLDEVLHQRPTLVGCQLAREGNLNLAVRAAVGSFVLVCCFPKNAGIVRRPGGHVAAGFVLQVLQLARAARQLWRVLALAGNVVGVLPRSAFASGFDCAVVAGHGGFGVGCWLLVVGCWLLLLEGGQPDDS